MEQRTSILLSLACLLLGGAVGWFLKPCPSAGAGVVLGTVDVPMLEIRTLPPDTVRLPGRIRYRTVQVAGRSDSGEGATSSEEAMQKADSPVLDHDTTALCPGGRYCVTPFVSDTTAVMPDGDSVRVSYEFPQNIFTLMRRQVPDTLKHTTRVIAIGSTEATARPTFWETVGTHVAAVCVGFVLGSVTQR